MIIKRCKEPMLVLSRKTNDSIVFPSLGITVEIMATASNRTLVGVKAPADVPIRRGELCEVAEANPIQSVRDIICAHLAHRGYDGLWNDDHECGCAIEDLVPCGEDFSRCKPGFKSVCDCGNDYFHAVPTKCWICDECSAEKESEP